MRIIVLILIGLIIQPSSSDVATFGTLELSEIISPAFDIALIYVSYSYSGWNAAAYINEEFKKSLSIALKVRTILITVLYTLLQFIF